MAERFLEQDASAADLAEAVPVQEVAAAAAATEGRSEVVEVRSSAAERGWGDVAAAAAAAAPY